MAKKSINCPKCERTFSMPAHLARHLNTIHSRVAKKKAVGKKRPKGRAKRKLGRPKVAKNKVRRPKPKATRRGGVVGGAMARLLAAMRAYQNELASRRNALDAEIAAIDGAMGALQGGGGKRRSKTGRRAKHR